MNKKILVVPLSIIMGCIFLGVFIYASQVKQKRLEIQYRIGQDYKLSQETINKNNISGKKSIDLKYCLDIAEKNYNNNLSVDIDRYGVQVIGAEIGIQELNIFKNAQDVCLRQYK